MHAPLYRKISPRLLAAKSRCEQGGSKKQKKFFSWWLKFICFIFGWKFLRFCVQLRACKAKHLKSSQDTLPWCFVVKFKNKTTAKYCRPKSMAQLLVVKSRCEQSEAKNKIFLVFGDLSFYAIRRWNFTLLQSHIMYMLLCIAKFRLVSL